jgi:hypothetical protein
MRKRQSNSATLNCFRARAPRAHDVAALLAPGHVGMPPYRPYTHAEAGPRPMVRVPRSLVPVRDVCGSLAEPRGACALATLRRPSAAIGPTAAARRRPLPSYSGHATAHTAAWLPLRTRSTPHRLAPSYKSRRLLSSREHRAAAARHWHPLRELIAPPTSMVV